MRPLVITVAAAVGLAWSAAILHARLHPASFPRPRAHGAARPPLAAMPIDAAAITISEGAIGVVAYRVPVPAGVTGADSLELRFRAPLDGAKVEAVGVGPQVYTQLLRKRVGGDTVVVPLAPGRIDAVDLRVHRNLRTPPIVRDARVLVPVTRPAADPPPAASPRSPR